MTSDAQSILERERHMELLTSASDTAGLAPLLAEEFRFVDPQGQVHGKAAYLGMQSQIRFRVHRYDDIEARLFGDAAVVTGRCPFEMEIAGAVFGGVVRYTRVHVRRGGEWSTVVYHLTPVPVA